MPTREAREAHSIIDRTPTSASVRSRIPTNTPVAAPEEEQEPISSSNMLQDDQAAPPTTGANEAVRVGGRADADADAATGDAPIPIENIDELVQRIIIHEDVPIEHLPMMVSPELKLIGRCVSLSVRQSINGAAPQSYHYTGLVSMVMASTVNLIYVNRYTPEDIKKYNSREQGFAKVHASSTSDPQQRDAGRVWRNVKKSFGRRGRREARPADPYTAPMGPANEDDPAAFPQHEGAIEDGGRETAADGTSSGIPKMSTLGTVEAAGSLAAALPLQTEEDLRRTEDERSTNGVAHESLSPATARFRHFRCFDGSTGPLPYVTFVRKSIRDVRFGRDPDNRFFSLFQDPSRKLLDMQYLRMLVRRYLVHTSEQNNPRQVPLYAFVAMRGAWPDLDRPLVDQLAREELWALLKADRAMEKEKVRQRRMRDASRPEDLRHYLAPDGLFSNTGILYPTRIPQLTFACGVVIVILAVAFGVYYTVILKVQVDLLVFRYLYWFQPMFSPFIVLWIVAGVCTLLHGMYMRVPLAANLVRFSLRLLFLLVGLALCLLGLAVLFNKLSYYSILMHMLAYETNDELCSYYSRHSCSGFDVACNNIQSFSDVALCDYCPNLENYDSPCADMLMAQLQVAVAPLLVLLLFILLGVLYGLYSMIKLVIMAKELTGNYFTWG